MGTVYSGSFWTGSYTYTRVKVDYNGGSATATLLHSRTNNYSSSHETASGQTFTYGGVSTSFNASVSMQEHYDTVITSVTFSYDQSTGGSFGGYTSGSAGSFRFNTDSSISNITIPAAKGIVDVNPKINGVSYSSGKAGFYFTLTGPNSYSSHDIDKYLSAADPGSYTATPDAKTGYTTVVATGSVAAGGSLTLVPEWNGVTTTVTLSSSGATTPGTQSVTATFDKAMPTITPPTRTNVSFLGYYSQPRGQGTKYYNADGTSAAIWDNSTGGSQTLYALWDSHDFINVSQGGSNYTECSLYLSQNGGAYTLIDSNMVYISQGGSNYTPIV